MNEFSLIADYFAPLAGEGAFGLKDDAAALRVPEGRELVLTKDAMIAGVHFFVDDAAGDIARKLLRVNLSDLAAKGAEPLGYLLACMLPKDTPEPWIADFAAGLARDQKEFGITLLGGDTAAGSATLCLSLTALGTVAKGTMLRRNGAKAGDDVYVSGTIGDAALFLKSGQWSMVSGQEEYLRQRYLVPRPRLALGRALIGVASACLDISDGLAADAGHIAEVSGVCLELEAENVPLSDVARACVAQDEKLWETVLSGGDDYELLFTAPPEKAAALAQAAQKSGVSVTRIGTVTQGAGVIVRQGGQPMEFARKGWTHF